MNLNLLDLLNEQFHDRGYHFDTESRLISPGRPIWLYIYHPQGFWGFIRTGVENSPLKDPSSRRTSLWLLYKDGAIFVPPEGRPNAPGSEAIKLVDLAHPNFISILEKYMERYRFQP